MTIPTPTHGRKTISIVSPCYNDADGIRLCHARVRALFDGPLAGYEREHVFADNASTDGSAAILRELAASDPDVRVILNARNVGVLRSTYNALRAASGDAVVPMLAVDLQDPPELIADFVARWDAGAQVVYGVREKRADSGPMLLLRLAFYRILRATAEFPIPVDVGEFQLIDRKVRDFACARDDRQPFIRGLIASAGFRTAAVPYQYAARQRGFSKNRLAWLFSLGIDAILTFSRLPLRVVTGLSALGALAGIVALAIGAFAGAPWLLAGLVAFFGGLNGVALGLIGEYVMSTHAQIRLGGAVPEFERINFPAEG